MNGSGFGMYNLHFGTGQRRWLLIGTAPVQAAASLSASPPHPGVAVGLLTVRRR